MEKLTGNTIIYFIGLAMIIGSLFMLIPSKDFILKRTIILLILISLGIFLTVAGGFYYAPIFIGIGGFIFSILIWLFLYGVKRLKGGNIWKFLGNLILIFFSYIICVFLYEMSIDVGGRVQFLDVYYNHHEYIPPYLIPSAKPYDIAILGLMDWIAMTLYVVNPIYMKLKQFFKKNDSVDEYENITENPSIIIDKL